MRVLFVSCVPLQHAVTRYRCTHLAEALRAAGHVADVTWIGAPVIRIDHDIVVLHRICANCEGEALADAVRRSGATLIYGADDLVFSEHVPNLPAEVLSFAGLHHAMLCRADIALLSTQFLAEAACGITSNVDVIGNFPSASLNTPSPAEGVALSGAGGANEGEFTVGYFSGSKTHDADLATIEAPLAAFLSENRERVRLRVVGPVMVPKAVKSIGAAIERLPAVPWAELPALIAGCHVNLAPLASSPLNDGKSAIKWQEAALARVATVASPMGEFSQAIDHGKDGLLCATEDEWYAALKLLLLDPVRRAEIVGAAFVAVHSLAEVRRARVPSVFENALPTGPTRPVTFRNPRGFAKSIAKKALKR